MLLLNLVISKMDSEVLNTASVSEEVHAGELEVESNYIDSLEVMSSSGDIMRELENVGELLTKVELDLACFSEKLLNLDILVMHVGARESDFEAFVSEKESTIGDSAKKALEFDLLSGILESEVKDLDNFIVTLRVEIDNAREMTISSKHYGEAFEYMQEKLTDCVKSFDQSLEQVSEMRVQSNNFQRTLLTCSEGDKDIDSVGNGYSSDLNSKIKMQTAEQQRHILRMFEKSLARELDLEKKLTDLRQSEEILKLKLQQDIFYMEEENEVAWEKLFEAENSAEVLLWTSKDFTSQLQIVKFNLNVSVQREAGLRSQCQELSKQLTMNNVALRKSEGMNAELVAKLTSTEKQVKESELQLFNLKGSAEKQRESLSKIHELEELVCHLKEKVSEAEKRADGAEAESKLLRHTNMELKKDSNSSTLETVNLLERQLRETDVQLQHAVASAEASQEKQSMLYSTIKDMEDLIEDLKSKVSKAESRTESAEEKCIILSETNSDLNDEIKFLRNRMECLDASLHQAEETKRATAKDIGIRTKLITDLIMKLALERERLHKQISLLTKEKKFLLKRLQHMSKGHSISARKDIEDGNKSFPVSRNDLSSGTSLKETNSDATGPSNTSHELDNANKDEPMGTAGVRVAKETSELDSVRNIDTSQLKSKYVLVAVFVLVIATLIAALFQHHSDCL
ncbi:WPP domain-interacting tail-anchored protein 1 isoform X1 [Coffea eugenioides]|uniref:WPP domain-interacting tail-anchored protein 1-like isoform X2 n=1 Tax=Coffea arabica TaxID=13443 RepID=A0ABM4V609_COFAR|nr:WPP domain-interacting tail-anchored protein 1 isoform X1 [Coffea eugenioides]